MLKLNINLHQKPSQISTIISHKRMAFKTTSINQNVSDDGRRELTIKEFKRWLMRFDTNKDGRISKTELRQIVKANGGWFSGWKGRAGIKSY